MVVAEEGHEVEEDLGVDVEAVIHHAAVTVEDTEADVAEDILRTRPSNQ